ncbi:MAG TPA: hypothetical protein VF625_15950, partial [Longimicrobium sp.]
RQKKASTTPANTYVRAVARSLWMRADLATLHHPNPNGPDLATCRVILPESILVEGSVPCSNVP